MTEHPNAAAARRSYEAWNSGDLDVIRAYFTDDAVLHLAGNNAMSGTYRGRDAVMDAIARNIQGWGPHAEVETILGSDDHVIVFCQVTSERDGKTLDVVLAQAIKFNAEGKVTEAWFLPNDQRGYDQFFS
jgi:ketosteroid isomerase-like protein